MTYAMKIREAERNAEMLTQKSIVNCALNNSMSPSEIVQKLGIPEEIVNEVLEERKANKP